MKSLSVWEAQGVGARGHHGEWARASPREPATANQASSRPRLAHREGRSLLVVWIYSIVTNIFSVTTSVVYIDVNRR